jgi:hypothetical protein
MIKISKYKYPENTYLYGNYLDTNLFKENNFTHIFLPMLFLNTIEDIDQLFNNTNKWLIHNGYLIIMFIDLDNFSVSSIINKSPSSFFKDNFKYEIEINKNNITDKIKSNGYERTDIQSIYHHRQDKIIYNAQLNGLIFKLSKPMEELQATIMIFKKK